MSRHQLQSLLPSRPEPQGRKGHFFGFIGPYLLVAAMVIAISLGFGYFGGIDQYTLTFPDRWPFVDVKFSFGGFSIYLLVLRHELFLVLLLFAGLLYLMRPGKARVVVAAAPIIVLYLSMELYYTYMASIVKVDDLLLLPEGLMVAPWWIQMGFWLGVSSWALTFLFLLKRSLRQLLLPVLLFLTALIPPLTAVMAPGAFLHLASSQGVNIVAWSDRWTVIQAGRTTSAMLFVAAKKKAKEELALLPNLDLPGRNPLLLRESLGEKRNIHFIVLESFFDPQAFKGLKFLTPPAPPEFQELRRKMHVASSTVFGGGTAQAEFELLCGVPSLELYTSAEFNMLDGSKTPCLPNLLSESGYRTIATQSYKPDFFNSEKAYKSLGFEEIHFPTAFAGQRQTYLQYHDRDNYMFDGDLFEQNLAYVAKTMAEGRPIFNYVLGTYGHLPHETDLKRFPHRVEIVGVERNSQTDMAINQFYYRAEALVRYFRALRALDPKGLILITSDHLPALDGGPHFYEKVGYSLSARGEFKEKENIWFYDGPQGKETAWPDYHYEFMDFLLDILSEARLCEKIACKNRQPMVKEKATAEYNHILMRGSGLGGVAPPLMAGTGEGPTSPASPPSAASPQVQ
jgi:phosphoglycerol transferase MdoB-like AlkP superfamily enzyme